MAFVVYKYGITILYKCYNLKYKYSIFKKCPDEDTNKCMHCKYGKAELSAEDVTRLLDSFGTQFILNAKTKENNNETE